MRAETSPIELQRGLVLRLTQEWFDLRRPDRHPAAAIDAAGTSQRAGGELEPDEVSRYGADPPWI